MVTGSTERVTLQAGDLFLYNRRDGTVGFTRPDRVPGNRLIQRKNGDDKYYIGPLDISQVHVLAEMIGDASNLSVRRKHAEPIMITYEFIER